MKLFFLVLIIFIFIINQKKLYEPVILRCCGDMNLNSGDYKETDTEPPKKWKRCFKPDTWDSMPCTSSESSKCCGGKGICRPTRYGGKCELKDRSSGRKFFIYDEDGKEKDYGPEEEKNDRDNYTDDDKDDETRMKQQSDINNVFFIVCIILIFILLAVLIYFLMRNNSSKNTSQPLKQNYYNKYSKYSKYY